MARHGPASSGGEGCSQEGSMPPCEEGQPCPADPWTPTLLCTACEWLWGEWPGWAKVEVRHKNQRGMNFLHLPKEMKSLRSRNT